MKDKLVKLGLTDEMAQKVIDNFGDVVDGEYITKARFNEVNKELKQAKDTITERDSQIESLKNDETSSEELKNKIKELEKSNKEAAEKAKAELDAERKSNAIKLELMGKVHNADITMSQLKLDEIIMDDNGKVKSGLKEQLSALKKSDSYLFIEDTNNNGDNNGNNQNNEPYVKGATPKDGEGSKPSNLSKGEQFAKNLAAKTNEALKSSKESSYFD